MTQTPTRRPTVKQRYTALAERHEGTYKGHELIGKPVKGKRRKSYYKAEFPALGYAFAFINDLPKRSRVYITQYGLITTKEGEDTDRVGTYGWSNLNGLSDPGYILAEEESTRIRRKSGRVFSPYAESVYVVRWKKL